MSSSEQSEVTRHIGNQNRTLRFKSAEVIVLEDRLGCDVLTYLARGGGTTKFCADAVIAGLSGSRTARKELTPATVATWLDSADWDREEFQKDVLYAIARGKPGEEGMRMAKVLDEVFADLDRERAQAGQGPTHGG